MVNAVLVRLSVSYNDCSGAMDALASYGEKFIVYQHDADAAVSRTHIHAMIVSPTIGIEGLKKVFKRHYGSPVEGGNKFWSWKETDDPAKTITYMSKGSLAYKFQKGFSQEEVETLRLAWVQPSSPVESDKKAKYDELQHIIDDWGPLDGKMVDLETIRHWVFAWYWRRDAKIPPANQYKRMAGSLYLRIAEVHPAMSFSSATSQILNLWY